MRNNDVGRAIAVDVPDGKAATFMGLAQICRGRESLSRKPAASLLKHQRQLAWEQQLDNE